MCIKNLRYVRLIQFVVQNRKGMAHDAFPFIDKSTSDARQQSPLAREPYIRTSSISGIDDRISSNSLYD